MGRPPSNGAPAFRFNHAEVAEMEAVLQENQTMVPSREVLAALAEKFSKTPDRAGKVSVQWKQVWNWFQNRRYALRSKTAKPPGKLTTSPIIRDEVAAVKNATQGPQPSHVPSGRNAPESSHMEFEAKSARDGAWYDVQAFLSHRYLETGDPEVLVRFAGFGSEEDEWINVRRHVRPRSLPCESSECAVVLPGDLILCFQEGKEQALYFDAHVLDAQRRRHDVRGCRCRFLVRYDHDQSEEIVPLRKVCRRPETDYRLQQLNAMNESSSVDALKAASNPASGGTLKPHTSNEAITMPAPNPIPKIGHVVGPVQPQGNASVTGITAAMGASEQKKVESPAASAPLAPSSSEAITTPAANPSLDTGHVAVPVRPEGNARFTSGPVATAAPEQKEVESAAASAPLAPTSSEAITTPAENPCLNDGHVAVPVQPQGNTSATSSLPAAMVVPEQQEVESAAASAPLAGSSSVGTSAVLSCDNVKSG